MAVRWRHNALSDVEFLIADGLTFSLSPNLTFLADVERTVFAARVVSTTNILEGDSAHGDQVS